MIDDPTQVEETVEEEMRRVTLTPPARQAHIPKSLKDEYNLRECVADMIVSQDDVAARMPDTPIDDQGRFVVPKKLAHLYDIDADQDVTVFIIEVVMR